MLEKKFLNKVLESVNRFTNSNFSWDYSLDGNYLVATTTMNTLIGRKKVQIYCNKSIIYGVTFLAEDYYLDNLSQEDLNEVLWAMNNVNFDYGNILNTFVLKTGNCHTFFLRSFITRTDLELLDDHSQAVLVACITIGNFINCLRNHTDNDYLVTLDELL